MRFLRTLSIVFILIFSMLMLSGCGGEVWSFDFTTASPSQLDDWFIDSFSGTVNYTPDGAVLDDQGIASPVSFDGDWTMSVVFDLDVDDFNTVYFELFPGSSQGWEPNDYIYSYFDYVGMTDDDWEEWYVDDTGDSASNWTVWEDEEGVIPGLNRDGENTWKITKSGDHYTTYMNSSRLSSFTADYCDGSEDFFLNIYAELDGGSVTFKSVEVKYKGSMY